MYNLNRVKMFRGSISIADLRPDGSIPESSGVKRKSTMNLNVNDEKQSRSNMDYSSFSVGEILSKYSRQPATLRR